MRKESTFNRRGKGNKKKTWTKKKEVIHTHTQIVQKESMSLKESGEGYMGVFGEKRIV